MSTLSTISANRPVLLLGCGKMGSAMLAGWLKQGLSPDAVQVIDPYIEPIKSAFTVLPQNSFNENVDKLSHKLSPSFGILAVKPQMMDDALESLQSLDLSSSVILSVAAGKTIDYFSERLGSDQPIIRAMPNTPAAIGRGVTVCYGNRFIRDEHKKVSTTLLETVSTVEWVSDEGLMDAVTALSGSGPAYVFSMVEAMAAAGEAIGLPSDLSKKLARETVCGAGALLDESEESASQLRENVTSPGGTTAAALDVLMGDDGIAKIMRRAMQQAKLRSKELAG